MKLKILSAAVLASFILTMPLQAEFVFLKDGSIIEGKIVSDSAVSITMKDKDNKTGIIPRTNIMRILYTSLKLGKIYIQKRDGEGVVAFMVDEDRDSYTFRKDLFKPAEFVLQRSDVLFIAEKNPSGLKGVAETDHVALSWLPPYDSVKHYNIYYSQDKKEKYKLAGNVWGKSYTLKNLSSNKTYYVIVTSVDSDNYESSPSNELKITTKNVPPSSPEDLKKTITSDGRISISWSPSRDIDGSIKEYKISYREKHQKSVEAGSTAKTEFALNVPDYKRVKEVSVRAVDSNGDYSVKADFYHNPLTLSISPMFVTPFGELSDLYSFGYGAALNLTMYDTLFDDFITSVETGYLHWGGRMETINNMVMLPVIFNTGYRYFLTDRVVLNGIAGAGFVYMNTEYVNAVYDTVTSGAFEPVFKAGISIDYNITENIFLSAGGGYYFIYEKSGLKNFAGVHLSAGYKI